MRRKDSIKITQKIIDTANKLQYTSVALISLGFNKPQIPKYLWFYIYDEDILPARCYSPSIKSPQNTPKNTSSMQFEIYFTREKPLKIKGEKLINHVVEKGVKMGLFKSEDICVKDFRIAPFGNVTFYKGMEKDRKILLDFLAKNEIIPIGRFGKWEYLWSDEAFLSGKNATDLI